MVESINAFTIAVGSFLNVYENYPNSTLKK
jgi:hypothetical protein